MKTIEPVGPRAYYRSYSNPQSQGTLIKQTNNWPRSVVDRGIWNSYDIRGVSQEHGRGQKAVKIPDGLECGSSYVDRMQDWDRDKWKAFVTRLAGDRQMCLNQTVESASDEELIESAKLYFEVEVTAVRWVYYFNVATGYDCQRIDYLYKPMVSATSSSTTKETDQS